MGCKLVSYLRVSTDKQGKSGLGLEAQEAAIKAYRLTSGCELIASYTEVESGGNDDRPELAKAIGHAKLCGATLVIAKLDRLSRDAAFLLNLRKSGVRFVACDMPNADSLMVGMVAVFGERERALISDRTKAALAAYKARGGLLGGSRPECRNLTDAARQKGARAAGAAAKAKADDAYGLVAERIRALHADGLTLTAIADRLNSDGLPTRQGKAWSHVQVLRVLNRAGVDTARRTVAPTE